ncbi:MAG: hypothetical protein OHK93_004100 [Ramalina farinacea]|uniref:Uncharacterized protein n=1 Tax=Ramalina farinacea TaxID=258253 RepID=A0AA43TNX2_9LECA|nr:hypothetical protein [Ramalina farinacea]
MGTRSGGTRESVNHIAHLLHSQKSLSPYSVRCEEITKPDPKKNVSAAKWGPLIQVEIVGFCMSVALFVLSLVRRDGFALLATLLLSGLSSLIGVGSQYKIDIMSRRSTRNVPKDSIVIKYPNGAFRVIRCEEEVARGLYWAPEECKYKYGDTTYRLISLVGTLALMVGVVCLANSTSLLQVVFAVCYLALNALYWVVAALPPGSNWDLSCYDVEPIHYEGGEDNKSFTQALWKAIAITESADWVKTPGVAPVSKGWELWVKKAKEAVERHQDQRKSCDEIAEKSTGVKSLPDFDWEEELTLCLDHYVKE